MCCLQARHILVLFVLHSNSGNMAKQLSVRIGGDLEDRMEAEKEKHEFPPTDSEIVRAALDQYLEGNPSRVGTVMATAAN